MILARKAAPLLALAATTALLAGVATPNSGDAADHLDAPGGMSPSGNAQADINDLFAFQGTTAADTVLAMTVHPVASNESSFGSDVTYSFNVDTGTAAAAVGYDSDGTAEITYDLQFSEVSPAGTQSLFATRTEGDTTSLVAFGRVGDTLGVEGGGQLFTGLRSDPFFFDLAGFQGTVSGVDNDRGLGDGDQTDFFAPLDTLAIVLEVPDTQLDDGDAISVWATTTVDGDQVDRMGRPGINTVITDTGPLINADEFTGAADIKDIYNSLDTAAADIDNETVLSLVKNSIGIYSSLDTEGSYSDAQLDALADVFLPDVLPFDKSSALPSPVEGRALADDVIDVSLIVLTGGDPLGLFADRDATGGVNSDGIPAHDDYLDVFPYLGAPNGDDIADVDNGTAFAASLNGANEVPAVSTDASGRSALSLSDDGTTLSHLEITYGLEDVAAAHIHLGGPDVNGPVVAFLYNPDAPTTGDGILTQGSIVEGDLTTGTMADLANVLNDGFAYVNVHTASTPSGEIRGQVVAANRLAADFDDVTAGGVFADDIAAIAGAGITLGCGDGTSFCTSDTTTRAQMAQFLQRTLQLPASSVDAFTDDDGSPFEAAINAVAAAGIAQGKTAGLFAPMASVTRGEMAAFISRAWDLDASAVDAFGDDDGTIFEDDINALAAAGIAVGDGSGNYNPGGTQTRGQMASFLARALGWS